MDPLSSYNYTYPSHDNNMVYLPQYSYNVKPEGPPVSHYNTVLNPITYANPVVPNDVQTNIQSNETNNEPVGNTEAVQENLTIQNDQNTEEVDTKEHIMLLPDLTKRKKGKGRTSTYWNKKIQDANFPFYGCTICNISFQKIQELDQHITIHKGRLTSYGIRLRNKSKKKQLKKQQKPLKKLKKKIKNEIPIEIKPENGYIGNEKASEFVQNNENLVNNQNNDQTKQATLQNEKNDCENVENSQNVHNDSKNVDNEASKQKTEPPTEDTSLQKLFKCFACQKQFSLSYYLKLHVRSHTGMLIYCPHNGTSYFGECKIAMIL